MKLTQATYLAIRLTISQNASPTRRQSDKFVSHAALLLAGLGVGVSSFSVKQLLSSRQH